MIEGSEMTDLAIRTQLQSLQIDFFTSLQKGSDALEQFDRVWTSFSQSILSGADQLQADTLSLIYGFAATVGSVAGSMLDLRSASDALCSKLSEDVTNILEDGMDGLRIVEDVVSNISSPVYIKPAYDWLLEHIHDPYPTKDIRTSIASQTKCLRKDIDTWFIDARKRMGWNSLRKKYFSNRRADIVDAAVRFFVKPDPKRPLESLIESEFVSLQVRAHEMYSGKFGESALASKLDIAVKDMTLELKTKVLVNKSLEKKEKRRKSRPTRVSPYPTPDRSPRASPELSLPSPTSSVTSFTALGPSTSLKRKRRDSLDSSKSLGLAQSMQGCSKRRVNNRGIVSDTFESGLPSPAASTREELEEVSSTTSLDIPSPSSSQSPSAIISPKRKRRLSETDRYPTPKRPNNMQWPHRPHAVSDPLSVSSNIWSTPLLDNWYSEIFVSRPGVEMCADIPSPVTVEAPDPTAPLEIEIFNFPPSEPTISSSTFPIDGNSDCSTSHHITPLAGRQSLSTPAAAAQTLTPETLIWFEYMQRDPAGAFDFSSTPSSNQVSYFQPNSTSLDSCAFLPPTSVPNLWADSVPPNFSTLNQGIDFLDNVTPQLSHCQPQIFDADPLSEGLSVSLSKSEKEAKKKELLEIEAQLLAIRAEIVSVS